MKPAEFFFLHLLVELWFHHFKLSCRLLLARLEDEYEIGMWYLHKDLDFKKVDMI